jgi:hypothetical protein
MRIQVGPLRHILILLTAACSLAIASRAEPLAPPERERTLIAMIEHARIAFDAAKTAEAKQDVRLSLQIQMHDFMALTHDADHWIGVFKNSEATGEGDRTVEIEIAPGVLLKTMETRFADGDYETLIRPHAPLKSLVGDLKIGEAVVFTASMIGTAVGDDDQMVRHPTIVTKFLDIRRAE